MMAEISVDEADLDHLLTELQTLKRAGCRMKDSHQMWCSDWLKTKKNAAAKTSARNAKVALSRMKAVQKAMEALTDSLKAAIQDVADQASNVLQIVGFSSLPDDVLARVFELYHGVSSDRIHGFTRICPEPPCSPTVLTSVCKRFRRIALHLPSLWEEIRSDFTQEWISCLMERCRKPQISIRNNVLNDNRPSLFLRTVHPTQQWKGLHIKYDSDSRGHEVFKLLCLTDRSAFQNLEALSIHRDSYFSILEDEGDGLQATTMVSAEDDELLSKWPLPRTKFVRLTNIIPRSMFCSSLEDLTIELEDDGPTFFWDIDPLKELLWSLYSIRSLTLKFSRAKSLAVDPQRQEETRPTRLLHLTTLRLEIMFETEPVFLRRVMDMLDAPNMSKISIYMQFDSHIDPIGPEEWIRALFQSSTGMIRTFPNVKDLDVVVDDVSSYPLPYETLLRGVPGVRNVTMDLAHGIIAPVVKYLSDEIGCLKDIRSLRLKNCNGWNTYDVDRMVAYFVGLRERGELDRFERLELEGCEKFTQKRHAFERLLGEKFVWKD